MISNPTLSFTQDNIPYSSTDVALRIFSFKSIACEERQYDYMSPLSGIDVEFGERVKPIPCQVVSGVKEKVFSLFGKMCDFDERQQMLYTKMLQREPVVRKISL